MKFKVKTILEDQGYTNVVKRVLISLFILVIIIIIAITFIILYYPKSCEDFQCFSNALNSCKKVTVVREDSKASWYYEIKGRDSENACKVRVKILSLKQGPLDIEDLQGEEMICSVKKGELLYPEENIDSCTGLLKEELQGIIIQKMHSYIIKNIGEIKGNFTK
ncbi:MAG: hypothetical protein QXW97_03965 [Candidatus Pacearchaeota archaeon]